MKIPVSWLKKYVDVTMDAHVLAEMITNAGMEVEQVEQVELIGVAGAAVLLPIAIKRGQSC